MRQIVGKNAELFSILIRKIPRKAKEHNLCHKDYCCLIAETPIETVNDTYLISQS